jgi:hypothetical protein
VLVGVPVMLLAFWIWSVHSTWATHQSGFLKHPPLYGIYRPTWSASGIAALVIVVALSGATPLLLSERVRAWVFLPVVMATTLLLSFTVNLLRGRAEMHRVLNEQAKLLGSYGVDAHTLRRVGVHAYVSGFPHVYRKHTASVANRTHPPGALVVWNLIVTELGHGLRAATVIAAITTVVVVSAWLMGREIGGERAGRIAGLLVAVAPATLFYAYTTMDGIYAALLSMSGALLLLAAYRRLWWVALLGGLLVGLTSFLTYAASFIAFAGAVAIVLVVRAVRPVIVLLASAGAGGLAALAVPSTPARCTTG